MKKRFATMLLGVMALAVVPMIGHADTVTIPTDPATYVDVNADAPAVSVWSESNHVSGLQKIATDQDGDGIAETPADTQML